MRASTEYGEDGRRREGRGPFLLGQFRAESGQLQLQVYFLGITLADYDQILFTFNMGSLGTQNLVESMTPVLCTCSHCIPVTLEGKGVLLKLGWSWYCLSEKIFITWQWQVSALLTEFITQHVKRKKKKRAFREVWRENIEKGIWKFHLLRSKCHWSIKGANRKKKILKQSFLISSQIYISSVTECLRDDYSAIRDDFTESPQRVESSFNDDMLWARAWAGCTRMLSGV